MNGFLELESTRKLKQLAQNPPDLTATGYLTPKRIEDMATSQLGVKFFYATERVDNNILETLFQLAKETKAIDKMHSMQAGEAVNKINGIQCENRSALHTAMRDFFEYPETTLAAKEAANLAYQELEKLKNFLSSIGEKFTHLVQIGIGGSDLGPRAIYLGLKAYQLPNRKVHFISNVDPDDAADVFLEIDLKKTLFVIVSKSGTTLETLTNQQWVTDRLKKAGLNPRDHLLAVTGKGSPMDDSSQYLASFYIWDYVGGRYSVTSMVGGVTLAFALGIDSFFDFLRGASAMDKLAKEKDLQKNLPLLSALLGIWNHNFLGLPTCAIIPYAQALSRFPAHLQQLDMESNGKHIDKEGQFVQFETGPIIWGEPGTNGQHSFFQLLHQGTAVVPLEMIGFRHSQYTEDVVFKETSCQEKLLSNLFAQAIALALGKKDANPNKAFSGNRPSHILFGKKLDPYSLGSILAYYEHKVAFQGFIWNINSFDQEGVQLGKVLALKMIDQFILKNQKRPLDENFPLGAAYLKQIDNF